MTSERIGRFVRAMWHCGLRAALGPIIASVLLFGVIVGGRSGIPVLKQLWWVAAAGGVVLSAAIVLGIALLVAEWGRTVWRLSAKPISAPDE